MDRAQLPYVVLGDIAYQMKNQLPLHAHRIVFGLLQRYTTPANINYLKLIGDEPVETLQDGWRIVFNGIPTFVKIMYKDYPTLLDPDIVFYAYDIYRLPNPFNEYWAHADHLDR